MSILDTLGAPVIDREDPPPFPPRTCRESQSVPEAPAPEGRQRAPRTRVATALTIFLLALVAGLVLGKSVVGSASPEPANIAPSEVTSLAEFFVASHLSGATPAADLAAVAPRIRRGDGATGFWVNHTAALVAVPSPDGGWIVTVAADMLEATGATYESAGIHYYEVAVDTSGPAPVVTAGPARIPRPGPSAQTAPFAQPAASDQRTAVVSFLQGYLTGAGSSGRDPAGPLSPLFPDPPYVSIEVAEVVSERAGVLRAAVIATAASGAVTHLEYSLRATRQDGLWEIAAGTTAGDSFE